MVRSTLLCLCLCGGALQMSSSALDAQEFGTPTRVTITQEFSPQSYGAWAPHPARAGVRYCPYYIKSDCGYDHHYVVRYSHSPCHCYCFNPVTRVYWGRWYRPAGSTTWTFSYVEERRPNVAPGGLTFGPPSSPVIPGTSLIMAPPPDLPPV